MLTSVLRRAGKLLTHRPFKAIKYGLGRLRVCQVNGHTFLIGGTDGAAHGRRGGPAAPPPPPPVPPVGPAGEAALPIAPVPPTAPAVPGTPPLGTGSTGWDGNVGLPSVDGGVGVAGEGNVGLPKVDGGVGVAGVGNVGLPKVDGGVGVAGVGNVGLPKVEGGVGVPGDGSVGLVAVPIELLGMRGSAMPAVLPGAVVPRVVLLGVEVPAALTSVRLIWLIVSALPDPELVAWSAVQSEASPITSKLTCRV